MAYWLLLPDLELIWFSNQQSIVCGEWFYQENVSEQFYQACNSRNSLFYISLSLATDSIFFKSCFYFPVYKMAHHWWRSVGPLVSFINLYSLMRFPWSRHIPLSICTHTYVCMLQSNMCEGNSPFVEAYKWNIILPWNVCTGPRVGCMFTLAQQES